MLGGKSVVMAGVHMRGDLHLIEKPPAEGEKPRAPRTAISIGKYAGAVPLRSAGRGLRRAQSQHNIHKLHPAASHAITSRRDDILPHAHRRQRLHWS